MSRDIFTMREVAQSLDVRNQRVEPDPAWLERTTTRTFYPIERAALPPGRYMLGDPRFDARTHNPDTCEQCLAMDRAFDELYGYDAGQ